MNKIVIENHYSFKCKRFEFFSRNGKLSEYVNRILVDAGEGEDFTLLQFTDKLSCSDFIIDCLTYYNFICGDILEKSIFKEWSINLNSVEKELFLNKDWFKSKNFNTNLDFLVGNYSFYNIINWIPPAYNVNYFESNYYNLLFITLDMR